MNNLTERIYDILFKPNTAMKAIAADKKILQAVAVVLISLVVPAVGTYFGLAGTSIAKAAGVIIFVQLLGGIFMWVAGTVCWHFVAELLGSRGSVVALFSTLGFAHLPRVFLMPLWAIVLVIPDGIRSIFQVLGCVVIFVWIVALDIIAIKNVYGVSGAKAMVVLLTPALVVAGAILVSLLVLGASIISWSIWFR